MPNSRSVEKRAQRNRRYRQSAKGREAEFRRNERRVRIGGVRHTIGFTKAEMEAMLNGSSN